MVLESQDEPVKTRIENSAPSATPKPIWNQIMSGASILASERNLTGKNILIGILGPDYPFDHPCIEKKIPYYRRFGPPPGVSRRPNPDDLALLHPIGIVAGNHPEVEMCGAPDSQLALAIVPHGAVQTEDLLNGIQWLMEPEKGHVPAAILICVDFNTVAPKAVRQILRACRNAGILPIIPAGNNPNRITGMAALPECITVGALDQWKARALFSGQGPAVIDQVEIVKPDLAEPGVGILGPSLGSQGYRFGTGTLQAAAHFAGIWAQMRESKPLVDTETMLAALATTTRDLATPGADNQTGLGLVDPSAALYFIENPPPPPVPVP